MLRETVRLNGIQRKTREIWGKGHRCSEVAIPVPARAYMRLQSTGNGKGDVTGYRTLKSAREGNANANAGGCHGRGRGCMAEAGQRRASREVRQGMGNCEVSQPAATSARKLNASCVPTPSVTGAMSSKRVSMQTEGGQSGVSQGGLLDHR